MVDVTLVEGASAAKTTREDRMVRAHTRILVHWRLCGHGERARHAESLWSWSAPAARIHRNVTITRSCLPSGPEIAGRRDPCTK